MIYVTRWETYNCGEGFVGIDTLADEIFIDGIYSWAEEAWNIHKNTGETNIINPYI